MFVIYTHALWALYFVISYFADVLKQVHVSKSFYIVVLSGIMLIIHVNGHSVQLFGSPVSHQSLMEIMLDKEYLSPTILGIKFSRSNLAPLAGVNQSLGTQTRNNRSDLVIPVHDCFACVRVVV